MAGLWQRAQMQIHSGLERRAAKVQSGARQLRLLSHESILERGFALVLTEQGKPVRQASQAPEGTRLDIRLAGAQNLAARVEGGTANKKDAKARKKLASKKPSDGNQGQLL